MSRVVMLWLLLTLVTEIYLNNICSHYKLNFPKHVPTNFRRMRDVTTSQTADAGVGYALHGGRVICGRNHRGTDRSLPSHRTRCQQWFRTHRLCHGLTQVMHGITPEHDSWSGQWGAGGSAMEFEVRHARCRSFSFVFRLCRFASKYR